MFDNVAAVLRTRGDRIDANLPVSPLGSPHLLVTGHVESSEASDDDDNDDEEEAVHTSGIAPNVKETKHSGTSHIASLDLSKYRPCHSVLSQWIGS